MPPLRTMSSIKPVKTERTHEENQERAYIAASRRSDRSLEARVESARRASEIHKRRTGRSLRVTEQDVVNEEMYEEEDDDLPMQYRRLTAHLQSQNVHLDRRLQAYVAQQVAMRTGGWAQGAYPGGDQNMNAQQFMNPGMMQMQQPTFQQHPMMPPQQMHRASPHYRQSPYPLPQQQQQSQGMRPQWHNRSASIATPQGYPSYQQQYPQSTQANTVEPMKVEDRRMSMPTQQIQPQTPQQSHQLIATPQQLSPAVSRKGSSSHAGTPQGYFQPSHSQSPQQVPTPPQQQSKQSNSSPFSFEQGLQERTNPLSMELPMDSQQLLAGSTAFGMNDSLAQMLMPSQMSSPQDSMKSQQPFYSYNPNGKPKSSGSNSSDQQVGVDGLSQTLAPASLDATAGSHDMYSAPQPNGTDLFNAPFDPSTMNFGFDNGFAMDPFGKASGGNSGNVSPNDDWMANMLQEDYFVEPSAA